MKILVTGAEGMLGQALVPRLGRYHEIAPHSLETLDITDSDRVLRQVGDDRPDWIVHAAAYTNVDQAEEAAEEAFRVNALGTRNLAVAAHRQSAALLYYSTDYIFDGTQKTPYREWDAPSPVNVYGCSKVAGEWFVRHLCPRHLIIRTSWLFGPGGNNFVSKLLQRARRQESVQVVDDQFGSPTFTNHLALMTRVLIGRALFGTCHVTNRGSCSWFEFAAEILRKAGLSTTIEPVSSRHFGAPASRPTRSVLENYVLHLEGIEPLPSWQQALEEYLREIRPQATQ